MMASEKQLRRQIRELTNEINSLKAQQTQHQREIQNITDNRLAEFKRRYEQELKRRTRETQEEYTRRIVKFQRDFTQETQRQIDSIKHQAEQVLRQQNEKLKELEDCNEELRGILRRMKESSEEADQIHSSYARELHKQVELCRNKTATYPHEFFFNGEFAIIDSHTCQISEEIRQKMYQAAVADANSLILEFQLLQAKVEQAYREWLAAFEDYRRIIYDLNNRIQMLEKYSLESSAGTFTMNVSELDFWSSNTYLPFKEKVLNAYSDIKEIEQKGVVAYLKGLESPDRKGIFSKVAEVRAWIDEFTGISNCILSERLLSDDRWHRGQLVEKTLSQVGYKAEYKRFRKSPAPTNIPTKVNPMDCFDVIETIQGKDRLLITFCPVRQNGVVVRNECIVSAFPQTLCNSQFVNSVVRLTVQRIQQSNDKLSVVGIPFGNTTSISRERAEEQRKKVPNPVEQIRYLERKNR